MKFRTDKNVVVSHCQVPMKSGWHPNVKGVGGANEKSCRLVSRSIVADCVVTFYAADGVAG